MSRKHHKYRHEFSGILGKRFIGGLHEYHQSTHSERETVLRLWKERGYQSRVKQRGELKDETFECPFHRCDIESPHVHYVDGDADIHGIKTNSTI
jgi:hypothetical protein